MGTERYTNDKGQVAVLFSPGFGAGWSTWNDSDCLFAPAIVELVLLGAPKDVIQAKAEELWPNGYWGGARDVRVYWMRPGTAFRISEYDGSESIEFADETDWKVA